jgi:lysophospholipase L1-like esterase
MLTGYRGPLIIGLLAGGLLASLILNLWLFRQSRIYERQYFLTRLDPIGLAAYSDAPPSTTGPRVVFYGDSRVRQWVLPQPPAGVTYLGRGIDGQSSRQALMRYDAHVAPLRPAVLVIQVGVNDLISIRLLEQDRAAIIANTRANIAALVARARADGAIVVLTTIFPAAEPSRSERIMPSSSSAAVAEVNTYLASLAAPDIIILDTAAILANDRGQVRNELKQDMWHLNADGYAALNAALAPILANLVLHPNE